MHGCKAESDAGGRRSAAAVPPPPAAAAAAAAPSAPHRLLFECVRPLIAGVAAHLVAELDWNASLHQCSYACCVVVLRLGENAVGLESRPRHRDFGPDGGHRPPQLVQTQNAHLASPAGAQMMQSARLLGWPFASQNTPPLSILAAVENAQEGQAAVQTRPAYVGETRCPCAVQSSLEAHTRPTKVCRLAG